MRKEYDKAFAIQLYKDSVEIKKIAEMVGVSINTIQKLVEKEGLPKRRRATTPAHVIMEMYEKGMSIDQIHKDTGASKDRIRIIVEAPPKEELTLFEEPLVVEKSLPNPPKYIYHGKQYLDVSALYM